jgi:hypothetical protein
MDKDNSGGDSRQKRLDELCEKALGVAKNELDLSGSLDAFAVIASGDQITLMESDVARWNDWRYRECFSAAIRRKICEENGDLCVFVSDAYLGRARTDFAMEAAINLGGDVEHLHAMGLVTKRECILIRAESRDAAVLQVVQFYRRDRANPRQVIWEEQEREYSEVTENDGGRSAGFFRERISIQEAYRRQKARKPKAY